MSDSKGTQKRLEIARLVQEAEVQDRINAARMGAVGKLVEATSLSLSVLAGDRQMIADVLFIMLASLGIETKTPVEDMQKILIQHYQRQLGLRKAPDPAEENKVLVTQ